MIEDRDDAGVAPEVGDRDLQTVEIRTVSADALRLGVSEPQVLQERAVQSKIRNPSSDPST